MHICLSPGHSFALAKLKLKCSSAIDKICLLSQARKKTINHFPNCFPLPKTCSSVHVCAQLSKHMDFKYLPALESQLGRFLRQLDASKPNGIGQADCGQLPVRAKPAAGDALLYQGNAGSVPPPHVPRGEPGLNQGPDEVFANPSARSHHKCLLAAVLPASVAVSACSGVGFTPLALSPAILSAPQPTHTMWGACT